MNDARRAVLVVAPLTLLATAAGAATEDTAASFASWGADLGVGIAFAVAGVVAAWREQRLRTGLALTLAATLWYVGNVADSELGVVAWLGANCLYLYRVPLIQASLFRPGRRALADRAALAVIAAALIGSLPALAVQPLVVAALAAALGLAALAVEPVRPAAIVLATTFLAAAVASQVLPADAAGEALRAAYQAGLVLTAAVVAAGAGATTGDLIDTMLADGGDRDAFTQALADAVGDPSLRVDHAPTDPGPREGAARRLVVRLDRGVAIVHHRAGMLDDLALREATIAAVRIEAANVALRDALATETAAIDRSRRRLVLAGDAQRARLEQRIRLGPATALDALDARLQRLQRNVAADVRTAAALDRARDQLATSGADLASIGRGLHPALATGGLVPGLRLLTDASPVPARLVAEGEGEASPGAASALLFVCSEALANAARHAQAGAIDVVLQIGGGRCVLAVADDGRGGAELAAGTGLRGLGERLAALGGRLEVQAREGGGTTVIAELDLEPAP